MAKQRLSYNEKQDFLQEADRVISDDDSDCLLTTRDYAQIEYATTKKSRMLRNLRSKISRCVETANKTACGAFYQQEGLHLSEHGALPLTFS